jgi:nucleotide-binding universal stress UspA family protein
LKAEKGNPFAPILLVVDNSDHTVLAARRALELAAAQRCKVCAVALVDTVGHLLKGNILVRDEMEEFEHDLAETSKHYLRLACSIAREGGVECEEVLMKGSWHQSILAKQREIKAGLVVVGGFTYSMVKRDLQARAKQMIIDDAPCPVLIVR